MTYKLGLLAIAACSHTAMQRSALTVVPSTSCSPITAYGAVPDDSLDDRPAVLAALAANACVYVPTGRYEVDTPQAIAPARRPYDMITVGSGQTLYGPGQLNFRGDAALVDWRGIHVRGDHVLLYDLTITTAEVTNTAEQTHAIHVEGPSSDVSIHDVTITHPARGHRKGGDSIDFVGYPDKMITDARIDHCHLLASARGGIQVHSGVAGLTITNSDIRAHVIAIDTEGSGAVTDLTIARNTFPADPANGGPFAIALDLVTGATIADNKLETQGIFMYSCESCSIVRNRITRAIGIDIQAVVNVIKASSDLLLAENEITRARTVDAGPVLHVGPHGDVAAGVRIVHNKLTQQTQSQVIVTEGIVGLLIADNEMTYSAAAHKNAYAIQPNGATGVRTTGIVVSRNAFSGPMTAVVALSGSYGGVGSVTMTANAGNPGLIAGLRCDGMTTGAGIAGPVIVVGNTGMPAYKCGAVIDED